MENEKVENIYAYQETEQTEQIDEGFRQFLNKVFALMIIGVFMTFAVTFLTVSFSPVAFQMFLAKNMIVFIALEFCVVLFLSVRITKISVRTATLAFFLYAILSGIVITTFVYSTGVFTFVTALLSTVFYFAILAIYGYTTKKDLSDFGTMLRVSLYALIGITFLNIFITDSVFDLMVSVFGLIVFTGFTIYDVNILKKLYFTLKSDEENEGKDIKRLAIIGALNLYLDFINLFINILRIFSKN